MFAWASDIQVSSIIMPDAASLEFHLALKKNYRVVVSIFIQMDNSVLGKYTIVKNG